MFVMNGLVRFVIGPDDRVFADGARFLLSAAQFQQWTGLQQVMVIKMTQAITIAVTVACVASLFWFLNKTRTGKSMRAYSDNRIWRCCPVSTRTGW